VRPLGGAGELGAGHEAAACPEAWIDERADAGLVVQVTDELGALHRADVRAHRRRVRVLHGDLQPVADGVANPLGELRLGAELAQVGAHRQAAVAQR
jgi:hypothetical protein